MKHLELSADLFLAFFLAKEAVILFLESQVVDCWSDTRPTTRICGKPNLSHTYKNLKKKIKPGRKATLAAKNTPLIHAVRSKTSVDLLVKTIINGYFDGSDFVSKSSTSEASKILGIASDAMFYYAGRAYPEQGGHAYLLVAGCMDLADNNDDRVESKFQGFACPFDTGGLVGKKLLLKVPSKKAGKVEPDEYKKYYEKHRVVVSCDDFRQYFAVFLHRFFDKAGDYWRGLPSGKIDGAVFKAKHRWRNWTFEVHTETPLKLADVGRMIISNELSRKLENEIKTASTPMPTHLFGDFRITSATPRKDADDLAYKLSA